MLMVTSLVLGKTRTNVLFGTGEKLHWLSEVQSLFAVLIQTVMFLLIGSVIVTISKKNIISGFRHVKLFAMLHKTQSFLGLLYIESRI